MNDKKTIADIEVCPNCGSENVYFHGTDEIEFGYDSKGHYRAYYHCKDCDKEFMFQMKFNYEVTN